LALWGPERVLDLINQPVDAEERWVASGPQFDARPEGLFRIQTRAGELHQTRLTNYRAAVLSDIKLDDGAEVRREFEISAELSGEKHEFFVSASEFASMDWPITKIGVAAITYPNQRDYARAAIQSLSKDTKERTIYTHTGWQTDGDRWFYLHAGGAIDGGGVLSGVDVRLTGSLSKFALCPPAPAEFVSAIRTSLRLGSLGPASVCFPLLAATYRAAFGNADFSLHLVGETGAFKSEVASIFQRHFGREMDSRHLPGAWSSTANSLEVLAFHAKDTLFVVDDFAPQGNAAEVHRYHAAAERLFRAAGNSSGRARLDSTAKLRDPKPPRSLILSTGEDIPKGHSLRARLLILELARGEVTSGDLSCCQENAQTGLYTKAMWAFLQWLAPEFERRKNEIVNRAMALRTAAIAESAHARTPDIVGNLQAGFEAFLDFAVYHGAVGEPERKTLADQCWNALCIAAGAQAKHQASSEPAAMFLRFLRSVLASGRAHLVNRDGGSATGTSSGDAIGFIEGDDVYLDCPASFRQVQLAGHDTGEPLPVTEQVLKKRLHEKRFLASVDAARGTLTVRRRFGGVTRQVLHFRKATIFPDDQDEFEPSSA
jgi:hypothetical protein